MTIRMHTGYSSLSKEDIERRLRIDGARLDAWGTGCSKTLGHLLRELESGEAELIEIDGRLAIETRCAGVNVFHVSGEYRFRLIEHRQVFANGRARNRHEYLSTSVSEKMFPGEMPITAARRALKEELGLTSAGSVIFHKQHVPRIIGPIESRSYPGLLSRYTLHEFEWNMPREHFRPEGYVEIQDDKSTFFIWQSS